MPTGPSPLNRAFNRVSKRAESGHVERLRDTFVDSGVATVLESGDHQVLYGRRGTGKTHALRYLETIVRSAGDIPIYIDLRTIGSLEGVFAGADLPPYERAARLLGDIVFQLHDALLEAALADDTLIEDAGFTSALTELEESVTSVRIVGGGVETETESAVADKGRSSRSAEVKISKDPELVIKGEREHEADRSSREVARQTGTVERRLNFSDVATALRQVSTSLAAKRVWLLLDEWSSVRTDTQPYLGEFIVKCIAPLPKFVVKIGAIEQQSNFRTQLDTGEFIGIELGADFAANVSLDDFMVFEQNEETATEFFLGLFFKHLVKAEHVAGEEEMPQLGSESDIVRFGFTEKRAFQELARAAEGVPRDAINVAAKAALRAGRSKISINDIRVAARQWFQSDKEAAIKGHPEAVRLLNWIADEVIRGKRARSFLVNQKDLGDQLLLALFNARILHVVRRGYSAQDYPGERFDIYTIDYGTYVDLIGTKSEPFSDALFELPETSGSDAAADVEVPGQDLRAIRRTILDLSRFYARDYTPALYRFR